MQRDINCLTDPDRNTRKRGLESIKKVLLGGKQLAEDVASSCLELLHRPLMKLMDDPVEKNRELALQLLHGLLLLAPRQPRYQQPRQEESTAGPWTKGCSRAHGEAAAAGEPQSRHFSQ